MCLGTVFLCVYHQGRFRAGNAREVKLDGGMAQAARLCLKGGFRLSALDVHIDNRVTHRLACGVLKKNAQTRVLAGKPSLGVHELQAEIWNFRCGRGRSCLRSRRNQSWLLRRFWRDWQIQRARTYLFNDTMVLVIEPEPESLGTVLIQREQIEIVVGPAMENPAAVVNRGVQQSVRLTAILGLNVEDDIPNSQI